MASDQPLPHRADIYAASIRQALADAEYDLPTDEVIAQAAAYCTRWVDLESAFLSMSGGLRGGPSTAVAGCLLSYKAALVEAGDPVRIAARHRFLAGEAEKTRRFHEAHRDEYAARSRRLRDEGRSEEAATCEVTADAYRRCAEDAAATALRLTARADLLARKAAA